MVTKKWNRLDQNIYLKYFDFKNAIFFSVYVLSDLNDFYLICKKKTAVLNNKI